MRILKIKGAHDYWVVLCNSGMKKTEPLICGVFASKPEAQELMDDRDFKECVCRHYIKRCSVIVEIPWTKKR